MSKTACRTEQQPERDSFVWALVQKRIVKAQLYIFEKASVVRTILGVHKANP